MNVMLHKDAQDQLEIGDQVKLIAVKGVAGYEPGIWIFDGYNYCGYAGKDFEIGKCDCKGHMMFSNSEGESFSDCLNYSDDEKIPIQYIIKKLDDNLFEI